MSTLLEILGSVFNFLFNQMSNCANFFTSTTLGQLILGIILLSIIVNVVMRLIKH